MGAQPSGREVHEARLAMVADPHYAAGASFAVPEDARQEHSEALTRTVLERALPLILQRFGVAAHLHATWTDRGFAHMPVIGSSYGGGVRTYESSAATGPHVWLNVTCPANLNEPDGEQKEAVAHLTLEDAERLRDQLDWLVRNHYQVRE